tara:strand:+ start:9078 stop:9773 length:696 start_codon:yes stop_codon:yes gene_type:complete
MNQVSTNIINFFKSILGIAIRDVILNIRNLSDIFSVLAFFIIAILIFIFAIGPDKEQLSLIGIPIIWTILILSSSISINKSLKEDYEDGNFGIYQFSGLSFEIIALVKIITSWILFQLPMIFIVPLVSIVLDVPIDKMKLLLITIILGSPSLTVLTIISSAMFLTNKKNLILGSLIITPMSIPLIIFAVGASNTNIELFQAQIYILVSILLALLALGPWVISACIKIALKN